MTKKSDKARRYVITGGPNIGKAQVIQELTTRGFDCAKGEIAREIYRQFQRRLGRHLEVGDRREYALEVLNALIAEFTAHKHGAFFYNRGIPDGFGWERFFGLEPSRELLDATRAYRYDQVFILDQLDRFEDESGIVWASEREAVRVHQLIVQGYYDAGYKPIFVPSDFTENRVAFILRNI